MLDDFGSLLGQAWRETGEDDTERATLIANLLDGQYRNPTRIIAFKTTEGWSRDVSEDLADELAERCAESGYVPRSLEDFLQRYRSTVQPACASVLTAEEHPEQHWQGPGACPCGAGLC